MTPILRPFTRALAPFGVVDATMPGSGKTILTCCIGLLVGQRVLTWTDAEDELRKAITTVLADQVGVVVFDNLVEGSVIDSAVLARLVTERTWTDRRLGSNTAANFPNDRLWLATGNNLRTGGDMASRTVWVRLDPDCPHPEARSGFSIPNLDTWILDPANQATVLHHLLVLVVDWAATAHPPATDRPADAAVHPLGPVPRRVPRPPRRARLPDQPRRQPPTRRGRRRMARQFLHAWHNILADRPVTARDLRASAEPEPGRPDPWDGMFPTTPAGRPLTVKSLGRMLTGQVGRWRGNVVLRSATDTHSKVQTYWVEREQEHDSDPQTPQTPQNPP